MENDKGAYLIINSQIFPLSRSKTTIGRKLENDLVIQEPLVSRLHAEIRYQKEKYHIFDLASTSGTYLNNKRIEQGVLYSGDIILIANVPVMFVDESTGISTNSEDKTSQLHRDKDF
ncbi:MAG: FHA domain-containing protein [Anaerolineae bacterium]|nr:FHA domain-containing protein [Anaerolineae bacterium]